MFGPGGNFILSKLFVKADQFKQGDQFGLGNFNFGKGKFIDLDNKISTEEQMQLVMNDLADQVPKFSMQIPGVHSLESFFKGDNNFMMYEGNSTFGECGPATWIISLDTAVILNTELSDFDVEAKIDFASHKSAGFVELYQNRDPDNNKPPPLPPLLPPQQPQQPQFEPPAAAPVNQQTPEPAQQPQTAPEQPKTAEPSPAGPENSADAIRANYLGDDVNPFLKPVVNPYLVPEAQKTKLSKKEKRDKEKKKKRKEAAKKKKEAAKKKREAAKKKKEAAKQKKEADKIKQQQENIKNSQKKKQDEEKKSEEQAANNKAKNGNLNEDKNEKKENKPTKKKFKKHIKYEIYSPESDQKYGTIPKDCVRPWQVEKAKQNGKIIEEENINYLQVLSNKKLKWHVVYYMKSQQEPRVMIPHVVMVNKSYDVPQKFKKLPVWNYFTKTFDNVLFTDKIQKKEQPAEIKKESTKQKIKLIVNKPLKPLKKINNVTKTDKKNLTEQNKKKSNDEEDRFEGYNPLDEKDAPLFRSCDEGMNMLTSVGKHASEELTRQLKSRCNINAGDKLSHVIPVFGQLRKGFGGFFSSFMTKGYSNLAQMNEDEMDKNQIVM